MNKLISLILSVFIAGLAIAEPNGGCNFTSGSPGCVAYTGKGLTLSTQGPQDITFKTNDTARGTINGTTGAWTGLTLAAPTITGTVTIGALAGASPITVSPGSDANRLFSFGASSDTAHTLTWGDGSTANQTLFIGAATADAADSGTLALTAGGLDPNIARGAYLWLYGNEAPGSTDGDWYLRSGDVASNGGNGHLSARLAIKFQRNESGYIDLWTLDTVTGSWSSDATGGGDIIFNKSGSMLRGGTTDGADNLILAFNAGGADSSARGAGVELRGNEASGAGDAYFWAGNVAGGDLFLQAGGSTRLSITNAGATSVTGTFTSSATSDIGWSFVDATDNQACNTGCTSACVFGIANATGTAVTGIVGCADATADSCVCAGSS